jgi:hypothetical protein
VDDVSDVTGGGGKVSVTTWMVGSLDGGEGRFTCSLHETIKKENKTKPEILRNIRMIKREKILCQ